jgi:VanZ family protein
VIGLWLPVAVYMAAIYYGAALTKIPGPVAGVSDTLLHMAGYAGLAVLTLRATARGQRSRITATTLAGAFIIATVHGLTVEIEQMFIPSRFAEWRDVGNDVIGALIGLSAAWAWGKLLAE